MILEKEIAVEDTEKTVIIEVTGMREVINIEGVTIARDQDHLIDIKMIEIMKEDIIRNLIEKNVMKAQVIMKEEKKDIIKVIKILKETKSTEENHIQKIVNLLDKNKMK